MHNSTIPQLSLELTAYIAEHTQPDTIHHANGIIASTDTIQQGVVEHWVQQLLGRGDYHHHPDVLIINPEGQHITRQECATLTQWVYTKPYQAAYRVVHIAGAHRLNSAAANSLLKIIEEPPHYAIFFLSTHAVYGVPATIRSRMQWFWVPTSSTIQDHATTTERNERRQFWIQWLRSSIAERDAMMQETFHHSQKEAIHQLPAHLTTLQELFHDMILLHAGRNPQGTTPPEANNLNALAQQYNVQHLARTSDLLLNLERMVNAQVNKKSIIDYLTFAL